MGTLVKVFILFLLSQSALIAQEEHGQTITVTINNLDNDQGIVYGSLYDSEKTFLGRGIKSANSKIENNSCKVIFSNVPSGIYAISLYHDENNNKKMDSNVLGIPKEDYGCSNNAKGFMGRPKWKDAKFELKNKSIEQTITL